MSVVIKVVMPKTYHVVGICDRMLRGIWVIYLKISLNLMMIS